MDEQISICLLFVYPVESGFGPHFIEVMHHPGQKKNFYFFFIRISLLGGFTLLVFENKKLKKK